MGGTSELAAQEISTALAQQGMAPRVLRMERADTAAVAAASLVIVCTSSYGAGDVPDNAKALLASLTESRPDLSRTAYGVFALGDRHHAATYCFGGRKFDELLSALGAQRLVPMGRHDEHGEIYPEDAAVAWLEGWVAAVRAQLAAQIAATAAAMD
jgi:MioC protein